MIPENAPRATVLLDRPREIRFTLGALRRVREQAGQMPTTDAAADATAGAVFLETLPVYLWAMLGPQDRKELSVEAVADLLHPGNLAQATAAFSAVFAASMPEGAGEAGGAEGNAPAAGQAQRSTSMTSGPSAASTSA